MEYKNIDSQHILVRLDPNYEIITSLMQVAKEEHIALAMVQGLGAVKKVVMGVYNVPSSTTRPIRSRAPSRCSR